MKKLLILSAVCMAMTAQATVLRVSNRTNSGAPYSSISEAISAAEEGDTIMVDGSNTSYSGVTLTKRVVLIGPGFLLSDNSLVAEGSPSAKIPNLSSNLIRQQEASSWEWTSRALSLLVSPIW